MICLRGVNLEAGPCIQWGWVDSPIYVASMQDSPCVGGSGQWYDTVRGQDAARLGLRAGSCCQVKLVSFLVCSLGEVPLQCVRRRDWEEGLWLPTFVLDKTACCEISSCTPLTLLSFRPSACSCPILTGQKVAFVPKQIPNQPNVCHMCCVHAQGRC